MYIVLAGETSTPSDRSTIQALLIVTAASLIFPFLTILLDLYHYRVWWAYEPDVDVSSDVAEKPFSRKHKRFIPYVLTERFRTAALGNRKCKYGNRCQGRELEHFVIFHSSDYQPQPRWSKKYPTYLGFHRTTPQAAISIAKSEFQPSPKGMLGPGAYFARSTEATLSKIGKQDQTGAWFVAEISMGKVFQVQEHSIRPYRNNQRYNIDLHRYVKNGEWKHILRWVVVIEEPHDRKLSSYGLNTELYHAHVTVVNNS